MPTTLADGLTEPTASWSVMMDVNKVLQDFNDAPVAVEFFTIGAGVPKVCLGGDTMGVMTKRREVQRFEGANELPAYKGLSSRDSSVYLIQAP